MFPLYFLQLSEQPLTERFAVFRTNAIEQSVGRLEDFFLPIGDRIVFVGDNLEALATQFDRVSVALDDCQIQVDVGMRRLKKIWENVNVEQHVKKG